MIDIHSHVLFGIDDGATSMEMSVEMLRSYVAQGVTHVFCTSHSRCAMEYYHKNFARLQQRISQEQLPIRIYKGCEVECSEEEMPEIIKHLNSGFYPTMNGTKFVLVEFEPYDTADTILNCIRYIEQHSDYRPIVAHVERYRAIRKNPDLLLTLRGMGCLFQVNVYSLTETDNEKIKGLARQIAHNGLIDFLGSDAHRTHHRPPAVQTGLAYLKLDGVCANRKSITSEMAEICLLNHD